MPDSDSRRLLLVLVPARDEAAVIGDVIRDIGAQTALAEPSLDLRLVVIDDGSVDGTGSIARSAIAAAGLGDRAAVVRREHPTTKAAALAAGAEGVRDDATIVVLDADARIRADVIRSAVEDAGDDAATLRRRMLSPPAGTGRLAAILGRVQDDEETVDHLIRRLRFALAGSGELRGDGMVVPFGILRRAGGWPVEALCEDLEISAALTLAPGQRVRPLNVEVWEQPALEPYELLAQRIRWAEGAIRRDLRLVWPRIGDSSVPVRRRIDAAGYAAQTLLGPALGALAIRGRGGRALAGRIVAGYGVAGLGLALAALARDGGPGDVGGLDPGPSDVGPRMRDPAVLRNLAARAVAVVAFGALWPVVTSIAWARVALGARPGYRVTRKARGFSAPWDVSSG